MAGTTRQRATSALRAHAPELLDAGVAELGHGLDNTAFVVGDLVLRVADGGGVGREARLLEALGPHVSIPPGAMPRIEFFARCAALEDLAFGRETGRHEYAINAERSFGWLFPQRP